MEKSKNRDLRIVVNKSTVPIGSHRMVAEWIARETTAPFEVVSNPEFLKEGSAVDDFLKPDRVVIGTERDDVFAKMAELYAPFVRQGNPILKMDTVSAEITKYACNAFLATRISFMNELSRLCELAGGDIEEVRKGMSGDTRIGKHFLYAGIGYGGSCFPKDVKALVSTGKRYATELGIVAAVDHANQKQKLHLVEAIKRHYGKDLRGKTFGFWGLAFKPNTDDLRESPAIEMIRALIGLGASVKAFDPVATEAAKSQLTDLPREKLAYVKTVYEAVDGTDALVLATEWNEFRNPDWTRIKLSMNKPTLFDGRNIFDPKKMIGLGFAYFGIGRGKYRVP
jgi:UDPglucose 6-dehydrogenase